MALHVEEPGSSPGGVEEQRWTFALEALDEHEDLEGYDLLGKKKSNTPKSNLLGNEKRNHLRTTI